MNVLQVSPSSNSTPVTRNSQPDNMYVCSCSESAVKLGLSLISLLVAAAVLQTEPNQCKLVCFSNFCARTSLFSNENMPQLVNQNQN